MKRANLDTWREFAPDSAAVSEKLSRQAKEVLDLLEVRGASFFEGIASGTRGLRSETERAIAELVANGIITSDSYTGLRALLVGSKYRTVEGRRRRSIGFSMEGAGRWSLVRERGGERHGERTGEDMRTLAMALLRRYGIIFRRLAERESFAPPWRELVRVLRIMELRGEVRGGRFVDGVWGEQFALPESVAGLRETRRKPRDGKLVSISAADPLNLTGIITPGERVSSHYKNRVLYRDGVPLESAYQAVFAPINAQKEIEKVKQQYQTKTQQKVQANLETTSVAPTSGLPSPKKDWKEYRNFVGKLLEKP